MHPAVSPPTLADLHAAAGRLKGAIRRMPAFESPRLSALAGCTVILKAETSQVTASFKERGALNALLLRVAAGPVPGVIAMSAGNHAQGVAWHARRLGIPATIVMPRATPFRKVQRTESFGARVVLAGETVEEAAAVAHDLAARDGLVFIHPYDDPATIAGQGTLGIELLDEVPDLDAIVVPIGGGGLAAGIAIAAAGLQPDVEVIGVQAAAFPGAYRLFHEPPPPVPAVTVAEGIAVATPGVVTGPLLRQLLADVLAVGESALESAILTFLEEEKMVVEGAGAAPLAAVLGHRERFAGKRVALVVSGGNIDATLLATIIQRGLVRDGRITGLRVQLPDIPGALAGVAGVVGRAGANIVETHHQRTMSDISAKAAEIDLVVETRDAAALEHLLAALTEAGYPFRRLSS